MSDDFIERLAREIWHATYGRHSTGTAALEQTMDAARRAAAFVLGELMAATYEPDMAFACLKAFRAFAAKHGIPLKEEAES